MCLVMGSSEPTMNDVEKIARNAETAGRVYVAAAENLPTTRQIRRTQLREDALAIGKMQREYAHEVGQAHQELRTGYCPNCPRDYVRLCPQGWEEKHDGICTAPTSYTGPCIATAFFHEMDFEDKEQFEQRCLVCWSCQRFAEPMKIVRLGDVTPPQAGSAAAATEDLQRQIGPVEEAPSASEESDIV